MVIKYNFNIFYGGSVHKGKYALGPQKSYCDPVYSEWIFWSRRRWDRSIELSGTLQNCRLGVMLMAVGRMVFIHSKTVLLFVVELTWAKSWRKLFGALQSLSLPPCLSPVTPYQKIDWDILQIFRSSKKKSISIRQHQSGSS